ncbi:hypothetical protein PG996_015556 [Apiospora saccharicola]|uniref:Ecp2 effector protein-like domain-containing protein n=1 Tax=Apiospora saccharicola TaxID=335842 RepID=A0ABR1TLJ1_9PEZI
MHKGADYGVEDCPKSICKSADTKLCSEPQTTGLGRINVQPLSQIGDAAAQWSDCEQLLRDLQSGSGDPPKRLFLDGERHDAGGGKYTRIAGKGKCAIGFRAASGTPGNSFLAMSAADADVLFRTANRDVGGKEEAKGKLYTEGTVKCGQHTTRWIIQNGEKPIEKA